MAASATAAASSANTAALRDKPRITLGRVGFYILVAVILVYTIFPFYWALVTSFTPGSEIFQTPVAYFPKHFTFDNYATALENTDFLFGLRNSVIVTLATVIISLVIGSLGAYALGRMQFRGKKLVLYTILAMSMFPAIAVLGSLYTIYNQLGLFNTYFALILSDLTFTLPFTMWVLTNFFRSMPAELEEAALVDGASSMQTFRLVLLPLVAPGLVTTGLLAFIEAWNEYLFAVTFTSNDYSIARTAPVAIANFAGKAEHDLPWANIMAASVIVTIPLIILVLVFQRRILAGLTAGAVKG